MKFGDFMANCERCGDGPFMNKPLCVKCVLDLEKQANENNKTVAMLRWFLQLQRFMIDRGS